MSDDARAGVPERLGSVLYALGMVTVSLFSGVLLLLSLGSTAYLREENYEAFDVTSILNGWGLPLLLASLAAGLLLLCLLCALAGRLRSWNERVALVVAVALTGALGLWWVLIQGAHLNLFPDSYRLLTYAIEASSGDWSSFTDSAAVTSLAEIPQDAHLYFTQYPYQSGAFLVFFLVCRLFPGDPTLALLVINVLSNEVSLVCLYALGRLLLRSAGGRAALLALLVLCLPLWLSAALPYGNCLGLAAGALFLVLQARALSLGRDRTRERLAWVGASLVPLCAVMVVKSTFVLLGIAAVIAWVVRGMRERVVLPVALACAVVLVANAAGGVPARVLEGRVGLSFGEGMPKTSWMVIGLTDSRDTGSAGWWDAEAWEIMLQTKGDMDLQSQESLRRIGTRLSEFAADPAGAAAFFAEKLSTEWCDPTFESLYYSGLNVREDGTPFDPYAALGVDYPALGALVPWDGYQSVVYLGALLGFVRLLRRGDESVAGTLLAAVFLAGFGCYLLWEAKGIYTLPFFFMLAPVAAYGVEGLAARLAAALRGVTRSRPRHARA